MTHCKYVYILHERTPIRQHKCLHIYRILNKRFICEEEGEIHRGRPRIRRVAIAADVRETWRAAKEKLITKEKINYENIIIFVSVFSVRVSGKYRIYKRRSECRSVSKLNYVQRVE